MQNSDKVVALNIGTNEVPMTLVLPNDPGTSYVVNEIYNARCYPPVPGVRQIEVIVDVGANTGIACGYFRQQYPDSVLFGFEPFANAFEFLKRNAETIGRCKVFPIGLYGCDTTVDFFHGAGTTVTSSVTKNSYTEAASQTRVSLEDAGRTFGRLGITKIDVLKIDTEGCEVPILYSLRNNFLPNVEVVYLEFHSQLDRRLIDCLLSESHVLWACSGTEMNRGALTYVSRSSSALRHASPPL